MSSQLLSAELTLFAGINKAVGFYLDWAKKNATQKEREWADLNISCAGQMINIFGEFIYNVNHNGNLDEIRRETYHTLIEHLRDSVQETSSFVNLNCPYFPKRKPKVLFQGVER